MQQNARRTAENLATSLARVEGLEGELAAAGEKYEYVQRLRAYVADLCDCLQVGECGRGWGGGSRLWRKE